MIRPLAVGILATLIASPAFSTTFARLTTADLVKQAEVVCCVRCDAVEPRLDPRTGLVFTHVRLTVLEDLKGRSASRAVELRIVGGRVGRKATVVPGMPTFVPRREAIVCLGKRNRAGYPVVLAARRGVMDLRRDKKGRRILREPVTGLEGLKSGARVTLDAFRTAVRKLDAKTERSK